MNAALEASWDFHVQTRKRGRRAMQAGTATVPVVAPGRTPRVSKLMALAIKFDGLVKSGVVKHYADLARLGGVSRARLSQIQNLTLLAPDLQESLLFLPRVTVGRDPIQMHQLQTIALQPDWVQQRRMWRQLISRTN